MGDADLDVTGEGFDGDRLWRLAKLAARTNGLVPDGLRGKVSETFMVLMAGQELGLPLSQTLKQVHVIGGRVSFSAELLRARIFDAGHVIHVLEYEDNRVEVLGVRRDGSRLSVAWDIPRAERAGLLKRNPDVWSKYPRAMLLARATSELARAIFPDVTMGLLSYSDDETAEAAGVEYATAELTQSDGRVIVVDVATGEVVSESEDDAADAAWVEEARSET